MSEKGKGKGKAALVLLIALMLATAVAARPILMTAESEGEVMTEMVVGK